MSRLDTSSETRVLEILSDLRLSYREDDFSIQLKSELDRYIFVRIEPSDTIPGEFAITDLNHRGWNSEQEAKAIELGMRLLGAESLSRIWFQKPHGVRGGSNLEPQKEFEHLSNLLRLVAQRWPAFIDGEPWFDGRRLGVDFLA
ncbi:hypothetical protein M2324_004054 [Rhodovulum sulfidophilum]|uniref:hypothetical protein n=1 Tax=Rhodovulum sulfidophilum TaxID=35806 RepID=UPI0005AA77CB|nr:hypothetical protein [Rhodovulum sulfidophilum]ANB32628.1 hypothetical protein A6W98_00160 [Rhodovulum sulfidophilum DSM 1374]ANB36478.1 hypothetical protein A6024_00145 [Rhodovulum sulfidophilum]MCW2305622.1 hypothetical protein [Rhodovulum sulfidophilum]